jgi:hypothetical protein
MFLASVLDGHGVAHNRREADDSYRRQSRWESVVLNPPRGGFFVRDQITRCVIKEYANVRLQPGVHRIPASEGGG